VKIQKGEISQTAAQ